MNLELTILIGSFICTVVGSALGSVALAAEDTSPDSMSNFEDAMPDFTAKLEEFNRVKAIACLFADQTVGAVLTEVASSLRSAMLPGDANTRRGIARLDALQPKLNEAFRKQLDL